MNTQPKPTALACNHCGWAGSYEKLRPIGSVGRLHCPKCSSEYGTLEGVPAPDQKAEDPAGLDKLLLAAGKGCARFLEGLTARKLGVQVNLWDGKDGLGAVLEESLKSAGVPNKRLPDLFTPRAVLKASGVLEFAPRRPYYPNGVKKRAAKGRRVHR